MLYQVLPMFHLLVCIVTAIFQFSMSSSSFRAVVYRFAERRFQFCAVDINQSNMVHRVHVNDVLGVPQHRSIPGFVRCSYECTVLADDTGKSNGHGMTSAGCVGFNLIDDVLCQLFPNSTSLRLQLSSTNCIFHGVTLLIAFSVHDALCLWRFFPIRCCTSNAVWSPRVR